jgi:formyltetrahydrofolate deformylase
MLTTRPARIIATIQCPDQSGLVAAIASTIHHLGGNIVDSDHHTDSDVDWFVMRIESVFQEAAHMPGALRTAMDLMVDRYHMAVDVYTTAERPRVAILVSKLDHCLVALLQRQRRDELPMEIALIIANHDVCGRWADMFGIPYHLCPTSPDMKDAQERQVVGILLDHKIDLVILARYMQILSADFLQQVGCPVMNIHHSFLPAFIGANPYRQAHARGVKLIGATAHYATAELDEGPIIAQATARVTHRDTVQDLTRIGRDLEQQVLAQAVRLHLERRVLVYTNKTIVFD